MGKSLAISSKGLDFDSFMKDVARKRLSLKRLNQLQKIAQAKPKPKRKAKEKAAPKAAKTRRRSYYQRSRHYDTCLSPVLGAGIIAGRVLGVRRNAFSRRLRLSIARMCQVQRISV